MVAGGHLLVICLVTHAKRIEAWCWLILINEFPFGAATPSEHRNFDLMS